MMFKKFQWNEDEHRLDVIFINEEGELEAFYITEEFLKDGGDLSRLVNRYIFKHE